MITRLYTKNLSPQVISILRALKPVPDPERLIRVSSAHEPFRLRVAEALSVDEPENSREASHWRQALTDLVSCGFILSQSEESGVFTLTPRGRDALEGLDV